jgi:hypothetical protein
MKLTLLVNRFPSRSDTFVLNQAALLMELGHEVQICAKERSAHGYDVTKYPDQRSAAVYDDLRRRGDLFLPVSGHLRQQLLALRSPSPRVRIHRVGVGLDHFRSKDWSALHPAEGPVIPMVAWRVKKRARSCGRCEAIANENACPRQGLDWFECAGTAIK